jgi:hypothetical protein
MSKLHLRTFFSSGGAKKRNFYYFFLLLCPQLSLWPPRVLGQRRKANPEPYGILCPRPKPGLPDGVFAYKKLGILWKALEWNMLDYVMAIR